MQYVRIGILVVLAVLSLAAGAAKLSMAEQEVSFFASVGLSRPWLIPLGIVQVTGTVLAVFPRLRQAGAWVIGSGFALSTIILFMSGNSIFGAVSMAPVVLAVIIAVSYRRGAARR